MRKVVIYLAVNRFFLSLLCVFLVSFFDKAHGTSPQKREKDWKVIYEQNFEEIEDGKLPKDFFILEGSFSVHRRDGRKCLVLPGNPVGEHGFLFGPRLGTETMELSFSCLGGVKSRRHSAFSGAIGGIRGIHYRLNPVSKTGILSYLDYWKHENYIDWDSREWMRVCLQIVEQTDKAEMLIRLEVRLESAQSGQVAAMNSVIKNLAGKCVLWGFSYAEQEMLWDDLLIRVLRK